MSGIGFSAYLKKVRQHYSLEVKCHLLAQALFLLKLSSLIYDGLFLLRAN